ncbi:MAG: nitronate monooxygenase [Dictyoglomus sp.]|nr:nitronate monooxygenase [Dictyoglomus sp.]MDW8188952.1 nitronate monooxygenase [Dictyoglomus sp.]
MKIPSLKIGDLVARIPIIQGGMAVGISLSGLASAVAEEGGIGVIATAGIGMLEHDFGNNFLEANIRALRKEIRKAREKTKGIIGVNIMVALTNFIDMVKTSIEEKVDIIFAGAGLPLDLPKYLTKESRTKLVPIVSSVRAARIIAKTWIDKFNYVPDAFVVEGPLAGGHLGFKKEELDDPNITLEERFKEVLKEIRVLEEKYDKEIPVIPAGGIFDGKDIVKFLKMGAAGVQMATRFVATEECDGDFRFKKAYLDAKKEDIIVIKSPVGLPGRAIKNEFLESVERGEKKPFKCVFHCIKTCDYINSPYCIALALINAKKGMLKSGFAFAGANAYRVNKIVSVKNLIKELISEIEQE